MRKSIYLSETENLAMQLLADGARLKTVKEKCGLTKASEYEFHPFLHSLRKKTGITDIQDIEQCRAYLASIEQCPECPDLSKDQTTILQRFIEKCPPDIIGNRLGISEDETLHELGRILALCGIFSKDPQTQRMQARIHFAVRGNPYAAFLPLSETHRELLRVVHEGGNPAVELGLNPSYVPEMIREACRRSQTLCPGRDARKKLIAAYLATRGAHCLNITMDDPAF